MLTYAILNRVIPCTESPDLQIGILYRCCICEFGIPPEMVTSMIVRLNEPFSYFYIRLVQPLDGYCN